MVVRITALALAAAGALVAPAAPAHAAVKPVCLAAVNHPCAWQRTTSAGVAGGGLIDADDPARPTVLRVEVRIQRAWGSPWETVVAVTEVQSGSIRLSTPAVTTPYRTITCATGGPADDLASQTTTCTF
ncbi:hypothetical protein ACF9IK_09135 [Kitasatospora hibisci]|uniref:hypothetical protein n=1 Tax=Kitasatospora hibisci TaxID=3369522 RepID=UPI0037545BA8